VHRTAKTALLLVATLGAAAALGACGADGSDDLNVNGRNRGGPGAGEPGGPGGSLTDAAAALTPAQKAKAAFDALLPDLNGKCGSCHKTGVGNGAKWLEEPDQYGAIKKVPGIVVRDYQNSKLLTVGASTGHSGGPGVDGKLKDDATAWLKLESAMLETEIALMPGTDPVTITTGANTVDISKAGTGIAGAKITFDASLVGSTLSMSNLKVVAPATSGLQVTNPLFIVLDGTKETPDPVDSFSNVDQSVPAGATQTLGPGAMFISGFAMTLKVKIAFKALKATAVAGDAGAGGGCKSVATFTSSAAGPLTNQCRGCHGGANAGATGAMNLSALGTDNAAACAQALTKVTLANKPGSAIITRPRAGSGHPAVAGFNQAAHDAAMLGWINNE